MILGQIQGQIQRPSRTLGRSRHVSLSSRLKHLRLLEEAGLVLVERKGRERWNHLNPTPIREIYRRWIRPFEEAPADQLLRLKRAAEGRTKA